MKTKNTLFQNGDPTMKTRTDNRSLLPALIAGLSLILAGLVGAQTYTNLDGANPNAALILSGSTLYGTAAAAGRWGKGTVFALNTDGTGFRILHHFTGGFDGAHPWAGLILTNNTLYGTAYSGGSSGFGTVFAVNTAGYSFTSLHSFTGSDGAGPIGGLVFTNNILYGTTDLGGSSCQGTVFSLSFRPQLSITASGPNVLLTWPTSLAGFDYTGYTVQSTTTPRSSGLWSTNSPAPVIVGGQNVVTNPISGPQQFYRLNQ
jgi:uncharacterized repeat protein (TIGR03803 family)